VNLYLEFYDQPQIIKGTSDGSSWLRCVLEGGEDS